MVSVLADWQARCDDVIGDIEGEIANIKARAEKERAGVLARQAMSEKALNEWSGDKGVEAPASGRAARRMGGAARFGIGNKREFSADDHEDDGYCDEGGDGAADPGLASRMDVDEGAGSSSRFGSGMRHAKRVLGRKL
ncbi:Cop9 signalosome [Aspergillus sp. HF37]|nr:Cop9 signalosome [Aspergillus sp. HF37]